MRLTDGREMVGGAKALFSADGKDVSSVTIPGAGDSESGQPEAGEPQAGEAEAGETRLLLSDSSVAVYDLLAGNVIDGGEGGAAGSSTASRTGHNQKDKSVKTIARGVSPNTETLTG